MLMDGLVPSQLPAAQSRCRCAELSGASEAVSTWALGSARPGFQCCPSLAS